MVTCKDVPEGKKKLCNMVFQEKIPEETPVFVRIALKYRGMRLSEIMEHCLGVRGVERPSQEGKKGITMTK